MNEDEYRILLKTITYDFVDVDKFNNLDKILNVDESRRFFEKAFLALSNASKKLHNCDVYSTEIKIAKNEIDWNLFLIKISCILEETGFFDVLGAYENIVHRHLHRKSIPNRITSCISSCGYKIPENAIISAIAAGKNLWPLYSPEKTLKRIEKFIVNPDRILVKTDNKNRMNHRNYLSLAKIFMGCAIIASNIVSTIDSLNLSSQRLQEEIANSFVVCVCMGFNFMWMGLDCFKANADTTFPNDS